MGMDMKRVIIAQGEHRVSGDRDLVFAAILGSCVATCVYDSALHFGAMNHILLPGGNSSAEHDAERRYGAYLMEVMLNDMYKRGSRKRDLVFKIFGGSSLFNARYGPGEKNVAFVRQFLEAEGFAPASESLGGPKGRRIEFTPSTGKVLMKFLQGSEALPPAEPPVPRQPAVAGEVDLF